MEQAYQFASGPLFKFCSALMVLGLLRKMALFGYARAMALKVTRDPALIHGPVYRESAKWLLPLGKVSSRGRGFAVVSMVFHGGLLAVPLFLDGHLLLLRRSTGIHWPSLPGGVADILSILALIAALVLLAARIIRPAFRAISKIQDYGFLALIVLLFLTGLMASRSINPFSYYATMFAHTMAGNILLALLPFSKLLHGFLFPAARIYSQVGWKLSPGSPGRRRIEADGPR